MGSCGDLWSRKPIVLVQSLIGAVAIGQTIRQTVFNKQALLIHIIQVHYHRRPSFADFTPHWLLIVAANCRFGVFFRRGTDGGIT